MKSDTMKAQSEAKWTSGPWVCSESYLDPSGTFKICQQNGDRQGLYIGSVDRSIPSGEANARLISQAPEMVQALQEALECLERMEAMPSTQERIRDIIARVKGEKP